MTTGIQILLGTACIAVFALLFLQQRRRAILLDPLPICRRRLSGDKKPPHSPSPNTTPNHLQGPNYVNTFPPSRRFTLAETNQAMDWEVIPKGFTLTNPDWTKNQVPLEACYHQVDPFLFTPCQFSILEIKKLGNLPDYATLSGVPLPKPYLTFDIKTALPRPYRPLRWPYHQTMALAKMEPDWWLEIENTYSSRIKQRKQLYKDHGDAVLQALPGTELACRELMEMALQFLCARYPHYFRIDAWEQVFHNGILHTETDLATTPPLHVLLSNIPEDFAIMLRDDKTGLYTFRAGIICSALGWNLASKIGLSLHEIHAPIPDYREKMQFSMDRYFAKLPTDKPIQRGSWGLEIDQPLYMPPDHPHEVHRSTQASDLALSRCHLRVDWQTLRRLPLSGSIVFNFKALFTPVTDLRAEPYIPGLLVKILNEGKSSLMAYKNTWHVEHVVKPALAAWHKEQVERGLVPENWEPRTLEESPWYPGWEQQWREKQGF